MSEIGALSSAAMTSAMMNSGTASTGRQVAPGSDSAGPSSGTSGRGGTGRAIFRLACWIDVSLSARRRGASQILSRSKQIPHGPCEETAPPGCIIRLPVMRLVTYDRGGARRLGAWVGGLVVDLPDAVGHPAFPTTMEALIALHGGTTLDAAREALSHPANVRDFRLPGVRLLPPVVPISLLESRWILGPDDRLPWPPGVDEVDYQVEVACIVGQFCRDVALDQASELIFGYTLMNDWAARTGQVGTRRRVRPRSRAAGRQGGRRSVVGGRSRVGPGDIPPAAGPVLGPAGHVPGRRPRLRHLPGRLRDGPRPNPAPGRHGGAGGRRDRGASQSCRLSRGDPAASCRGELTPTARAPSVSYPPSAKNPGTPSLPS